MPCKVGVASMWPVRFTDIIFASIILIVCAHGEGEGLIILSTNYFFEILSLCYLMNYTNNKGKIAWDWHFDLWLFLIRKCYSISSSAVLVFETVQVRNVCTHWERVLNLLNLECVRNTLEEPHSRRFHLWNICFNW